MKKICLLIYYQRTCSNRLWTQFVTQQVSEMSISWKKMIHEYTKPHRLGATRHLQGPLSLTWFKWIPRMVSNYIHYKVQDEITYSFQNSIGETVEVWKWINYFISQFTGHVITRPCWDLRAPGVLPIYDKHCVRSSWTYFKKIIANQFENTFANNPTCLSRYSLVRY